MLTFRKVRKKWGRSWKAESIDARMKDELYAVYVVQLVG
jgi:hypothetical protein